jgi:Ca2+-binding RTX toxin-like protein
LGSSKCGNCFLGYLSPPAFEKSDRLIYNSTTGGLFFDADGTGISEAIQGVHPKFASTQFKQACKADLT